MQDSFSLEDHDNKDRYLKIIHFRVCSNLTVETSNRAVQSVLECSQTYLSG